MQLKPCNSWIDMRRRWDLLWDLLGGTLKMRDQREKWLPREEKESVTNYNSKLARAVLFGGFSSTVQTLASKPFPREVQVKGRDSGLDSRLLQIEAKANRSNSSLTDFARTLFYDALVHGKTHVLVDFPQTNGLQSYGDESNGEVRPYFRWIPAPAIVDWDISESGDQLSRVLIAEGYDQSYPEDYYEFSPKRLLELTTTQFRTLDRIDQSSEFLDVEWQDYRIAGLSQPRIPLVTIGFGDLASMLASKPPLEELAWINLAHWQSHADHRNYLRFVRIGILFAKGLGRKDAESGITVSPNSLTQTSNPNADLKYVEHSGQAYEAGVKDLAWLEDRMEQLGLRPLVEKRSLSTATGQMIDHKASATLAQNWVAAEQQGLEAAYQLAAAWLNVSLPEDFGIDIFSDFSIGASANEDLPILHKWATSDPPLISKETALSEAYRRGFFRDGLDVEGEMQRIEDEAVPRLTDDGE